MRRSHGRLTFIALALTLGPSRHTRRPPRSTVPSSTPAAPSCRLDGVDNNARIVDQQNSSNVVSQPSVDALAEFSIQTNNFSAEYGQAAGAIVNATIRSGTNSFRGVAFEFVRNDRFDARNPFAASDEGKKLNRHQYGATLGGPVRRDRTFFFASWETTDEVRGVDYPNTIPTA